ncbi:MAG: NGG1p interacting factor NIF3 [Gaiellales bacterium]|nr:MAG: NGG1p interacting factor NIF3 [Gaiellales bacterium]
MKIGQIYDLAVAMGIKADPRPKRDIDRLLKKEKEAFDKLEEKERQDFDDERLTNPFADTRLLYGDPSLEVKTILAGVDMEAQEMLLADRLREKGAAVDLVLAHHPEGKSLAALADVMGVQADIWHMAGVPINIGEAILEARQNEVMRGVMPLNHQRSVQTAELLDIPLMCVHTPCDNLVNTYLQKLFDRQGDGLTLGDVVDRLREVPEYAEAARLNAGPRIIIGSEKRRAGKILVDMTGGTGGPSESLEKLADAGVGTLVGMHMSEKNRKEAEKHKVNVVIAGHDSSDSVGMNLFLDEVEKKGVKVIPCSGLIRISRVKKPKPRKKK